MSHHTCEEPPVGEGGQGQYTKEEALSIARAIRYESPHTLLQMPTEEPAGEVCNLSWPPGGRCVERYIGAIS
jgi:hypothetical protein